MFSGPVSALMGGRRYSYVALLRGESPDADSGRVCLDDPVHLPNILRRHAQPCAHSAHRAVGRSHERVGPCNDKEQTLIILCIYTYWKNNIWDDLSEVLKLSVLELQFPQSFEECCNDILRQRVQPHFLTLMILALFESVQN